MDRRDWRRGAAGMALLIGCAWADPQSNAKDTPKAAPAAKAEGGKETPMIQEGKPFPDFNLVNQDGKKVSLKDFAGRWLVLYVYPKDDTPGCTLEGKSFSAAKTEFDKAGITVVGLSQDDAASHKSFCDKYAFTVDLLADPKAELLSAAGVGQSDHKGTKYWDRTTFVIDPKGVLRKLYAKVNPQGHEKVVLDDIKKMQAQ